MPITPAHAVVAIPLRRLGLPVGALAIGSMVPDVAVFLPRVFPYDLTHSARGVVTVHLAVALVTLVAWWRWLREPVIDLLPRVLRERIPLRSPPGGRRRWFRARVVVALLLGGATHVLWDSFTHEEGRTAAWLPTLERDWGPWPGYQWLQVGSGVWLAAPSGGVLSAIDGVLQSPKSRAHGSMSACSAVRHGRQNPSRSVVTLPARLRSSGSKRFRG